MATEHATRPLPAGAGTRAAIGRAWVLPGALLVLVIALVLRVHDVDDGRMSPDDGDFLRSARVHALEPGASPATWIAEDRAWAGELAEDFGRVEGRSTYQHGYLHQLCIRYAVRAGERLGFGRVAALRLDQAVFGALTALLVLLWLRRVAPREPLVALAGGALMAVQLGHVLVSRTGWGQAACTFFIVWMIAIAWRMFAEADERDTRALARGALGIAVTSLLAYGFHEMATVYAFLLAVLVVLLFRAGPDGVSRWPWRSRRVLFGLLGCLPVGLQTIGLLGFSEYARETWFSASITSFTWWEVRRLAFLYLFDTVGILRQISWPILGLALVGLGGAFTRDVRWLVWLVAWAVLPTALLFLRFNFPQIARIYLPVDVIVVVLAAEGLGALWGLARHRAAVAVADAVAVLAIVWCGAVTWSTLFTGPTAPLYVGRVHHPLGEGLSPRRPFHDIEVTLTRLEPDAPVAVAFVWGPAYRALDLGYEAQFVELDALPPDAQPPRLVLAPRRFMESVASGRMAAQGGPYALAAVDRYDAIGLYLRSR
ncbi:MAG: hypothetical protein AAGB93_17410 [Planctomycetota bacterium]